MKESHKIRTSDGQYLYATIDYPGKTIPETVAIIVNGFLCDKDAAPYCNTGRWFSLSDIAVFRFNFFDSQAGARCFKDTDIETQVSDLEEIIDYVKCLGAKNVFLLAHSFGAHVALLGDMSQVDGIVMWDPSLRVPRNVGASAKYSEEIGHFILSSGQQITPDAFESLCSQNDSPTLVKEITCPIQVICAGNGSLIEGGKTLLTNSSNTLSQFSIINGAGHFFNEPGKEEELYAASLSWISNCLKRNQSFPIHSLQQQRLEISKINANKKMLH